jgi:hypothetical protein
MWIVMYVAMIASLSAMGMVPVAETGDPLPHDDAWSPNSGRAAQAGAAEGWLFAHNHTCTASTPARALDARGGDGCIR